ncbi:hypothetical protein V6667_07265 [Neisseria leonii]|uniref:DUF6630 domain-containing protein n=1 Tax=Neisseria leonii TaxID=2995413 RepID=A0A9X4E1R0_9NEIS|nr:hypothetical protein [Neisseria sp. 51.81]MDD9327539.1 hypothetical protein [Neisseria sp. 51.81]
MQEALVLIGILFAVTLMIALMFMNRRDGGGAPVDERVPLPPITRGEPVPARQSESEQAFRAWLAVLYQDNPRHVDAVVADVAARLRKRGIAAGEFPAEDVIALGAGEAVGGEHAFAVNRDDGESFSAYIRDMAARFRFDLADGTSHAPLPERMRAVYPQFLARNAVLYCAKTDGGFYFLMIVPKRDSEDFVRAAQLWGAEIRPADQPFD